LQEVPALLRSWVYEQGSLTARIRQHCTGEAVRVQLLSQRWEHPLLEEAQAVATRPGSVALVRQVYLMCGQRRVVYARSVMPRLTLTRTHARFSRLGTRPLADILFADPRVQRVAMEFARLRPGEALFRLAARSLPAQPPNLWGRRSVFALGGRPLLVSEVFLPALLGL
jgi:chorismate--pyruvate lyase